MRDKTAIYENMDKARKSLPRPLVFDPLRLALGFTLAILALSWLVVACHHRP